MDYLKGKITKIKNDEIVLENNDQGFKFHLINLNQDTFLINQTIKLYITVFETEFQKESYGFIDEELRDAFADLVQVRTVGSKTAINILEKFTIDQWMQIVEKQDFEKILSIKGIGTFTAKNILFELNKKYFHYEMNNKQLDVYNALEKMGYKKKEIFSVIKLLDPKLNLEEMTKISLTKLSQLNYE
ncbi:Holliday junction branch migration protein RuvA [Williamsoniiplasma lucivorax]|uniref:Holliday junction branch migration complex subunit RuvA n=1 Tax=Williamsoniiplasma lucivorax TaxID=209274 RepID=A0A2S5RCX4_9MOLU|nr:Holliday junction branch migration protein RuvA [Williamsoniiplasma lucivorax]PPE05173.1 Holliday junction DNA helicase RuvA [Williamsoniiplasma lucivorax]